MSLSEEGAVGTVKDQTDHKKRGICHWGQNDLVKVGIGILCKGSCPSTVMWFHVSPWTHNNLITASAAYRLECSLSVPMWDIVVGKFTQVLWFGVVEKCFLLKVGLDMWVCVCVSGYGYVQSLNKLWMRSLCKVCLIRPLRPKLFYKW